MSTEAISIIIPTKNRAALIEAKVRWALEQTSVAEVIAVADGCRDDTVERLGRIEDPRLTVLVNEESHGPPSARNTAFAITTSPWVASLDDDDEYSKDFLQTLQAVAVEYDAALVGAPWLNVPPGVTPDDVFRRARRSPQGPLLGRLSDIPEKDFVESPWAGAQVLMRREILDAGLRYDDGYRYNFWREETDFFVTAMEHGFRVGVTNRAYSFLHKRSSGGISGRGLRYEVWTVRNDIRFARKHGEWLTERGWIDGPLRLVARGAGQRVGFHVRGKLQRLWAR